MRRPIQMLLLTVALLALTTRAALNGKPVAIYFNLTVNFQLQ